MVPAALPRSSPWKKRWHKAISRVINSPERGLQGNITACGKSKIQSSLCQKELAPAGVTLCSSPPAPKGMFIHGQRPSRELTASAHSPEQTHGATRRGNFGIFLRLRAPRGTATATRMVPRPL